ncbi:MAG TPA: dephospho-CoA kinase [Acidiferrobacteraceae bacterium]|nr:dephospho-CoA kinase [Acidiferrobacteraceae bacterium]
MIKIGLTGGIASGKTTVANLFRDLGVPIIDADEISHRITEPGHRAYSKIIALFGDEVLLSDDLIDRAKLRDKIFKDDAARKQLESILHPMIMADMLTQVAALDAPYCILVIPLLLEANQHELVDRILVIDADKKHQLARLVQRDGIAEEHGHRILAAQISRAERLAAADDIIDNNNDPSVLAARVNELHKSYLSTAEELSLLPPGEG